MRYLLIIAAIMLSIMVSGCQGTKPASDTGPGSGPNVSGTNAPEKDVPQQKESGDSEGQARDPLEAALEKVAAPEPLTAEKLQESSDGVFDWFLRVENWTNQVVAVVAGQTPPVIGLEQKDLIINTLAKHYTDSEAEDIFSYFFIKTTVEEKEVYEVQGTEYFDALSSIEKNLNIEVTPSTVVIKGNGNPDLRWPEVNRITTLRDDGDRLRISDITYQ
ncbi:hypothetical protein [Phosphitispora fastidiosa]|uniref:hypothetical protein n=1 Tax=Phosphitispora fastidiosa TaxID=2837202 RepID=UPI001E5C794E|nr:hypothetical protein [Phosphitispora fastidiosa]MBU7008420.1 hypothetical protein [Phosphitispora fastidiosa]